MLNLCITVIFFCYRFFVTLSSLSSRVGGLSNQECMRLFDTHEQGRYVCSSHPDLVPALEMAENVGRRECETSFQNERWNCSGFSILKAPNITNKGTLMYVLTQDYILDQSNHAVHLHVSFIFAPIHVSV